MTLPCKRWYRVELLWSHGPRFEPPARVKRCSAKDAALAVREMQNPGRRWSSQNRARVTVESSGESLHFVFTEDGDAVFTGDAVFDNG